MSPFPFVERVDTEQGRRKGDVSDAGFAPKTRSVPNRRYGYLPYATARQPA